MPLVILETAFVLCWSSGYVTAEFALAGSAPFTVVLIRYVAATLLLLGWARLRGLRLRATGRVIGSAAFGGILSNALWLAALYVALDAGVSAGIGALLTSLQPLATVALGYVLFRRRASPRQWLGIGLGLGLGLAGVYLILNDAIGVLDAPAWAYGLPLISVLGIAVAFAIEKRRAAAGNDEGRLDPVRRLVVQFAASALVLLPLAWAEGFPFRPTPTVLAAFAWQILVLSIASYGLMWAILDRSDELRTSALMTLMPPVTLAMSWALLDEPLGAWKLVGFGFAFAGVWLMREAKTRVPGSRRPSTTVRRHGAEGGG